MENGHFSSQCSIRREPGEPTYFSLKHLNKGAQAFVAQVKGDVCDRLILAEPGDCASPQLQMDRGTYPSGSGKALCDLSSLGKDLCPLLLVTVASHGSNSGSDRCTVKDKRLLWAGAYTLQTQYAGVCDCWQRSQNDGGNRALRGTLTTLLAMLRIHGERRHCCLGGLQTFADCIRTKRRGEIVKAFHIKRHDLFAGQFADHRIHQLFNLFEVFPVGMAKSQWLRGGPHGRMDRQYFCRPKREEVLLLELRCHFQQRQTAGDPSPGDKRHSVLARRAKR